VFVALFPALARLVMTRFRWLFATGDSRDAEILALRHQVLVLQRQITRAQFTETDRTVLAVLASAIDRARQKTAFLVVKPETVQRWHRRLVARHWTQPPTATPGRPAIDPELRRLVIRLARENPTWGYRRIHGELLRLGYSVAASTLWKILRAAGINPTSDRTGPSWSEFIRSQAKGVIATDFACVDTALLRRCHILFVIEVASRRVHLAGITTNSSGPWTTQAARNLLMRFPDTHRFRFLVRDGAGQFTASFDTVLAGSGITSIRTPPRAPQANAYAERWVRTLRHELLDRTNHLERTPAPSTARRVRRPLQQSPTAQGGTAARTQRPRRRHGDQPRPADSATHHLRRTHQRVPHRRLNQPPPAKPHLTDSSFDALTAPRPNTPT
jgi:putative transposase